MTASSLPTDVGSQVHFSPIQAKNYSNITVFSPYDFRLGELRDAHVISAKPRHSSSQNQLDELVESLVDYSFLTESTHGRLTLQTEEGAWFGEIPVSKFYPVVTNSDFLNSVVPDDSEVFYRGGALVVYLVDAPGFEEQVALSFSVNGERVDDLKISVVYDGIPIDDSKLVGLSESTGFRVEPAVSWDVQTQSLTGGIVDPIEELSIKTETQNRIIFRNRFYNDRQLVRERLDAEFYPLEKMKYWYANVNVAIFPDEQAEHYDIVRLSVTDFSPFVNNSLMRVYNVYMKTEAVKTYDG